MRIKVVVINDEFRLILQQKRLPFTAIGNV